jgi:putative oxidoreductase
VIHAHRGRTRAGQRGRLLILAETAAAYFIAHFPQGLWPFQNKGEEAVFYCFVFLYMATQGAGIWSIDGAKEKG